jgi:hypothetical protein
MRLRISALVLSVLLGAGAVWFAFHSYSSTVEMRQSVESLVASTSPVTFGAFAYTHTNTEHHFSFKYPDGYTVRELTADGGDTILVEDDATHKGIQIYMTAYAGGDTTITPERVRSEVPGMTVSNSQPLNIGAGNGTGLAFESNNPAFGGASREVWFIFGDTLYQISAYPEYDALLRALFATWTFG